MPRPAFPTFMHSNSCVWTAPVDPERRCLPSPEELKCKILVKVRMHVMLDLLTVRCRYANLSYVCLATYRIIVTISM